MNPSTALATVLVDELIACGVRDAVLCPGSRNAPLSFALHAADAAGRLRLHVRIDERGAAFLALGLSARSGRPVPVVCTSGTAAANLHPATLEAHHAGVPLLVVTADRPAELYGTGANQTIEQAGLYGGAVRWSRTVQTPGDNALWRSTVCRAVAAARGTLTTDPGPIHLNVALRPPLTPDPTPAAAGAALPPHLTGRPDGHPWTRTSQPHERDTSPVSAAENQTGVTLMRGGGAHRGGRTLVVAGQGAPPVPDWLFSLPRVAEPGSPLWGGSLTAGPWLLGAIASMNHSHVPDHGLPDRPDSVIVVGRPTLHRAVQDLLADPAIHVTVLTDRPQWTDVSGMAAEVTTWPTEHENRDHHWEAALRRADVSAAEAVAEKLDEAPWPNGPAVARDVVAALPPRALLVLGSSNPIRDVALAAAPRADLTVHANRGVAGIDGMVSTAIGAALADGGPSYALLGDLTFLHDTTGLVIGPDEPRPELTIVVFNDDGGGIFSLLEQGAPHHAPAFERVFGTAHGVELAELCAAMGVRHTRAATRDRFTAALRDEPTRGISVVEVRAGRENLRDLHAAIRSQVAQTITRSE